MNLLEYLQTKASEAIFDTLALTKDNSLIGETADHYIKRNGEILEIPAEKVNDRELIKKATQKNETRLINALKSEKNIYKKLPNGDLKKTRLSDLKDNDHIVLDDYFDSDHSTSSYIVKDPDLGFSLGSFKLRSKSNLEFVKTNNKLLPYGHVQHTINDTYDFNEGTIDRMIAHPLEKVGKSHPYPVKATWKSKPIGIIPITEEELDTSQLKWIQY